MKALAEFVNKVAPYSMYIEPNQQLITLRLNNNLKTLGKNEIKIMTSLFINHLNLYIMSKSGREVPELLPVTTVIKNESKDSLEALIIIKIEELRDIKLVETVNFGHILEELNNDNYPINYLLSQERVRNGNSSTNIYFSILAEGYKNKVFNNIEKFLLENSIEVID